MARIDAHGEAVDAAAPHQPLHEVPRCRGRGTDDDAPRPPLEHLRDLLLGAQPAADLHRHRRRRDEAARQLAVVTTPVGAVQVDEVHPARPRGREGLRYGQGIVRGGGGARQPPALDINGGIELHDEEGN